MIKKRTIAAFAMSCFAISAANASIMTCKPNINFVYKTVSWNNADDKASFEDYSGRRHSGEVVRRTRVDFGDKVVLSFRLNGEFVTGDELMEFVVFPLGGEDYSGDGVGYVEEGGERYLNYVHKSGGLVCSEISF